MLDIEGIVHVTVVNPLDGWQGPHCDTSLVTIRVEQDTWRTDVDRWTSVVSGLTLPFHLTQEDVVETTQLASAK